jgi:DNA-binding MarR family transcriptional regulator
MTTSESVNTSSLEVFIGYNAKRVSFFVMANLVSKLKTFGLHGAIDFSVLSLLGRNPGLTSRQLCHALGLYPSNLVGIIKHLEGQGFLNKKILLADRRSHGLYLTPQGHQVLAQAEQVVTEVDDATAGALTRSERLMVNKLLRKIYS